VRVRNYTVQLFPEKVSQVFTEPHFIFFLPKWLYLTVCVLIWQPLFFSWWSQSDPLICKKRSFQFF